jgi:hypothetical protein
LCIRFHIAYVLICVGRLYCVNGIDGLDIALTKKCCCLENDQPENWWVYRYAMSEIAWVLAKGSMTDI